MSKFNTTKHDWLPSNEQFAFKFLEHTYNELYCQINTRLSRGRQSNLL